MVQDTDDPSKSKGLSRTRYAARNVRQLDLRSGLAGELAERIKQRGGDGLPWHHGPEQEKAQDSLRDFVRAGNHEAVKIGDLMRHGQRAPQASTR